jgi:hypothetical protein
VLEEVVHIFTTICFQEFITGRAGGLALLVAVMSCMCRGEGGRRVRRNSGKSFDWLEGSAAACPGWVSVSKSSWL